MSSEKPSAKSPVATVLTAASTTETPLARQRVPWQSPAGADAVLESWHTDRRVWENIVLDAFLPATAARSVDLPRDLADGVRATLLARGVDHLYLHQAEAFALGRAGRDFVVATPTASGKSLCYNLPVLDGLCRDPRSCALYLFPTKALSRDQEEALRASMRPAGITQGAITYDGDTPGDGRRAARQKSGVLITNPDMLHAGILPHHTSWARLFANLRYVVVDELHTYRGVFGSHLANVLRRLDRIARFHGSKPVYIFASATIGNPREHAARMIGRDVNVISDSGAPTNDRTVLIYNPPVVNQELGIRQSYVKTAVRLTSDLIRARVPTLLFGQSRNSVEVMLKYLRDRLSPTEIDADRIVAYRGGYLPKKRRGIEARLRSGDIACVVATNALELGIDIGSLDAVVCAGYPGSVAALWQRFGRGGRRGNHSLALLITSSAPLDQYFAGQPQDLIGAPVEQARIDPDNVEILVQHLKCAAFELPVEQGEAFGDLPADSVRDTMGFLGQHAVVHPVQDDRGRTVYHWSSDAYPANHVSLRSVGWDNFVVIVSDSDSDSETTLAEMDWRSTHTMLHEQAIYQHDGAQFQVERLDFDNHKAFVQPVRPDYYTTAMTHTAVTVIDRVERVVLCLASDAHSVDHQLDAGLGEVSVVEKVVGFKKIKFHTHENVGYGEVHLPEMQMHTTAAWFTVPSALVSAQQAPRPVVIDALRGLGKALHTVAVVGLMIDPKDLGYTLGDQDHPGAAPPEDRMRDAGFDPGFDPTVFLFDHVPGGVGLAPRIYDERAELFARVCRLLDACACSDGCPGCIGPAAGAALEESWPRKRIARDVLRDLGANDRP